MLGNRGSRQLESRVYREFVTVRFQRGLVVLDANQGKVRVEDHETGDSKLLDIPPIDYALRFQLVNDNFIAAIKGTDKNYLSLEDLYVNTAFSVQLTENERWSYRRRAL